MVVTGQGVRAQAFEDSNFFKETFYKKYGVFPIVLYSFSQTKIKTITLSDAEDVANKVIAKMNSDLYTIRSKTRLRSVLIYKHCMLKMLYDMGYTYTGLSKFFGLNHATILHAVRNINNYLKSEDLITINAYNILKNSIDEKYPNEPNI